MQVPKQGETLSGFRVTDVRDVPEYRGKGVYLTHEVTGCRVYHLLTEDSENVFSFNFKTPPYDNTGVAHIIEHAVLSGSKRYPLKDPFISLMKGSVQTYLNASTYPDKTMYPAATVLKKDYFNLMSVYGDAVFFPLLTEHVFMQEGYRVDAGEDGSFGFQGIVLSEMQGVYASQDSIAGDWAVRSLFPDSPYGYDSGGSPESIPDLSYEAFREFHRIYYHPSNCRVFLYGNIPTDEQCAFLQEQFLQYFTKREQLPETTHTKRWNEPRRIEKTSPLAEGQDEKGKTTILLNFRADPVTDPVSVLGMEILTEALMGNDGAPITKAILDSGLGDDLSPVSGLDSQLADVIVSIGIRGSEPDRAEAFEDLVFGELIKMAEGGISEDVLEGAIKRVEFRNREIRGGIPFGLRLMGKSLRGWMNGASPEHTMLFTPWMEEIKRRHGEGGYFEKLIRRQFLDNTHRSTLVVRPDREHAANQNAELNRKLEEKVQPGDARHREALMSKTAEFYRRQETGEESEVMVPGLSKTDMPADIRRIDTKEDVIEGIPAYAHDLFTNGIVYTDVFFDVSGLDDESALLLPFFSRLVTATGLPGMTYDEVARKLSLTTGGFFCFLESNTPVYGGEAQPAEYLVFRMKMLEENLDEALGLFSRIIREAVLDDTERIEDLVSEGRNDFRSGFFHMGHSLASLRAGAKIRGTAAREESWRGIQQFMFLEQLGSDIRAADMPVRLKELRRRLFTRSRVRIHAAGRGAVLDSVLRKTAAMVSTLPEDQGRTEVFARPIYRNIELFVVESTVGFASSVIPASRLGMDNHPAEVLIGRLLTTGFLWEQVRMRGGAYGVSAGADGTDGLFSMTSYRDPALEQTLRVFREGLEFVARGNITDDELEKVIITTVGKELKPLSPAEESIIGLRRRLYGVTDALRLKKHNAILQMDRGKVQATAEKLLDEYDGGASVVIGGRKLIDRTASDYPAADGGITVLPI